MILFLGLAGSGKSTQGHLLAAYLRCPWISTGNLLRESADTQTQKKMLKGEIIDDETTLGALDKEFQRVNAGQNQFVLDGSPRTMRQAEWLVEKTRNGGLKLTAVFHLKINRETARERLISRRRPDDHEAAITERFSEYDKHIKPIIGYLKSEGFTVHEIDGDQPAKEVSAAIIQALGV